MYLAGRDTVIVLPTKSIWWLYQPLVTSPDTMSGWSESLHSRILYRKRPNQTWQPPNNDLCSVRTGEFSLRVPRVHLLTGYLRGYQLIKAGISMIPKQNVHKNQSEESINESSKTSKAMPFKSLHGMGQGGKTPDYGWKSPSETVFRLSNRKAGGRFAGNSNLGTCIAGARTRWCL